jgi:hypothetical protein
VTSRHNSTDDLIRKILAAFEAGNKSVVKPVTLCSKIFFLHLDLVKKKKIKSSPFFLRTQLCKISEDFRTVNA